MRAILSTAFLAIFTAVSVTGCSSSSSSAASTATDQTVSSPAATDTTAAQTSAPEAAASTAPEAASAPAGAPPVYPGATAAAAPSGLGMKALPASAKTYSTPDDFAKVKTWYQGQLKGASEMQQPGMEKTEDAFLTGTAKNGMVVMIRSLNGKTWIVIGPPM